MSDAPRVREDASAGAHGQASLRLILFIAGGELNSTAAKENLEKICATEHGGRLQVRVVDVLEDYQAALEHSVLVTPCLIRTAPLPRVMIVGTLKDGEKVKAALRL